jgi:cold shock CspA family protein
LLDEDASFSLSLQGRQSLCQSALEVSSSFLKRAIVIQPDGSGKDVFVHISAVEEARFTGLAEGAKLSYEVSATRQRVGWKSAVG